MQLERLESRHLLSATISDGTLLIRGTPGDDSITIEMRKSLPTEPADQLSVVIAGESQTFTGVQRILIYAGAGDDRILVQGQEPEWNFGLITIPCEIHAGAGRDAIFGGGGDDVIFGGRGADMIFADSGDDQLFGRPGRDTLIGGIGGDTIRGGLGYDTDADASTEDPIRAGVENSGDSALVGTLRGPLGAVGGETPGWALELGTNHSRIEVLFGEDSLPESYVGLELTLTGVLTQWNTVERGKFAVLDLSRRDPVVVTIE